MTYLNYVRKLIFVSLQILGISFLLSSCQGTKDETYRTMQVSTVEVLPNGIKLPAKWPPRYEVPESPQEMPVPYLEEIPPVIGIEAGRQLFVDDFLIEETNLERVFTIQLIIRTTPYWSQKSHGSIQVQDSLMPPPLVMGFGMMK